jgi:hypothetical protein
VHLVYGGLVGVDDRHGWLLRLSVLPPTQGSPPRLKIGK